MKLAELQRRMAADVMRPLGPRDRTAVREAEYVKPNDRLSSVERLELYNRQYWFRLMDALQDDYPGLRAVLGSRGFQKLAVAYLQDSPSRSFTLRDLGRSLEAWLRGNPSFAGERFELAVDMARLEWAHVESFDGAEVAAVSPEDLAELNPRLRLALQPHVRLLDLRYPVDDLRIRFGSGGGHETASHASEGRRVALRARAVKALRPAAVYLATHRVQGSVYYRRLDEGEFLLLRSMAGGLPLIEALESAVAFQERVEGWFASWAQLGWLCRAR